MLKKNKIAFFVCFLFFLAYSTLSVVRHNHFGSFGFDLGISDQIVWKYSQFQLPITTVQSYPFTSIFTDHIEFIYILLSPFYWIFNSPVTLLLLQAFMVSFSGIPIYLLTKKRNINQFVGIALLFSYLMFYGIQNAVWFDVHSLSFGAAFLAWFIYFLDIKAKLWTILFFILGIICKEDIAFLTEIISLVYFIKRKDKISLILIVGSGIYLFSIFYIYFPHFTQDGYRYQNEGELLSKLKFSYLYDNADKRNSIFYSVAWFGFLPLLIPFYILPALADLTHYFVFANSIEAAQGLFMHYRVTLAPLLILPTIIAINKFKILNNKYVALYLILFAAFFQYYLHLPLSYLTKQWFWREPTSVKDINAIIPLIPPDASVASQNNITPHIAHRHEIFTLWPEKRDFKYNSPCTKPTCNWLRWAGNPSYLVVNTALDWDIRHLLANREDYIDGLDNLEKAGIVEKYKQNGSAVLYKVIKTP